MKIRRRASKSQQAPEHLLSPSWLVVIETCVCRVSEYISSERRLTLSFSSVVGRSGIIQFYEISICWGPTVWSTLGVHRWVLGSLNHLPHTGDLTRKQLWWNVTSTWIQAETQRAERFLLSGDGRDVWSGGDMWTVLCEGLERVC